MIKIRDMTDFTLAEPAISAKAMQIHYEQHYKTYVNNANELLGSENEDSIIDLIDNLPEEGKLYNNVAQIFNHEFFFEQFTGFLPNGPCKKTYKLILDSGWNSLSDFYDEIIDKGSRVFGSGYVWVIKRFGTLRVITTPNAINVSHNQYNKYIMTIDLWEHAYYLDYLNDRKTYIKNVLDCIDWDVIDRRL